MKRALAIACLLGACAPRAAVVTHKPAFDFAKIHRVAVAPFEGSGGPALTAEFVRQLLASGLQVSESRHGVDAV
jgi:hypothetical protein